MTLQADQAEVLHTRVEQAQKSLRDDEWQSYLQWCVALPARLRENGLVQTLRLLRHQAAEDGGACRLLQDWLLVDGSTANLHLARVLPGIDAAQRAGQVGSLRRQPSYTLASRLALAEAQRLKRSAEAVHVPGRTDDPLPGAPPQPASTHLLPQLDESGKASDAKDFQEHFGRYWRFDGVPPAFAENGKERDTYRSHHVTQVLAMAKKSQEPASVHGALYKAAYQRWLNWLAGLPASMATAQVRQRLMLGMGAESVHETQLLMHPVTGMPYLPGSTIKGALRTWLKRLQPSGADEQRLQATLRQLLGSGRDDEAGGQAGAVCFLDAWWVPGSDPAGPLVREVETPHHSAYYAGRQAQPTAWDAPIPVAQMAQRGSYLLAIAHAPLGKNWADALLQVLAQALGDAAHGGLGSKAFAAGYGRMEVKLPSEPKLGQVR